MKKRSKNEIVKEALEEIKIESPTGNVDPRLVVKKAQSSDSPIHKYFEWDDKKAGYEYRLWQARQLIASVEVEEDEGSRVFHSFYTEITEGNRRGYYDVETIMSDEELKKQALKQMYKDAVVFVTRWKKYKEMFEILKPDVLEDFRQKYL